MKLRDAFTALELVFIIVIIGILASVAIPKFSGTRNDAVISKAKGTIGSVRSAVAMERQKRILKGNFTTIKRLSSSSSYGSPIFDAFDGNTSKPVLAYPPISCANSTSQECWKETRVGQGTSSDPSTYTFYMPVSGVGVVFALENNRFDCDELNSTYGNDCKKLTH
ncbi:MAG: type II secretion system GspH family protein [Sulfurovum sp.]|nr:type II secretion system GspH family protein [Sulfurovum sp.]MCB4744877.1 type II secretion system GspH family protein [Sulfurovum sp.]MCB4745674.1 type II secretion system GspH family protein [Sulfurovum sp.]MCB4747383.1 type II secretion system GspH family protein [Sulfurovum sp.]MCB4749552.1 type II secretion system GspH family protein [Sulfurovum sp.]